MTLFSTFFIALLVSMLLVPPLMRFSGALGLVDVADGRKVHEGVIPRSGGIAIVLGSLVPILIWWPEQTLVRAILLGALVIVVFGFLDDRRGLHFGWKFFGQFLAVAIVIGAGLRIEIVPFFGIQPVSAWLSIPLTFLFIVGVTNAINLSDGLDGLAAGTSLIALAAIGWLFYQAGETGLTLLTLAVLGGICGFLRYNNHPALIFMGDTGSQFLGFMTAVLAIMLTQEINRALNPALLLLFLGLPILDTLAVMIWRIRRGRSPFLPDRRHFHHRLLEFGFHHYEAVSVIYVAQALLVATALIVRFQSDATVVGVYLAFSVMVLVAFRVARVSRFRMHADATADNERERRNLILRSIPRLPDLAGRLTEVLASVFLIFAAVVTDLSTADKDTWSPFAWTCAILCVASIVLLAAPSRYASTIARLTVYTAGVCAVYALTLVPLVPGIDSWHVNVYMLVLGAVLLFAIRLTRRDEFRTTPLDLLIVFFVLTVIVLTSTAASEIDRQTLTDTAIRLAVFFYATEFLCSSRTRQRWLLRLAGSLSLAILAVRGFLLLPTLAA